MLSSHLLLGVPNGIFPSNFPTKILYAFLISPFRATCPACFILLDLITLIIFGGVCKLYSSPASCHFLPFSDTLNLSGRHLYEHLTVISIFRRRMFRCMLSCSPKKLHFCRLHSYLIGIEMYTKFQFESLPVGDHSGDDNI